MEGIRAEILAVLEGYRPMTARQLFYQLVARGAIAKTEREYKGTVIRLLAEMRRDQSVPFSWIADNTRLMRRPTVHTGLRALQDDVVATYRRDLWRDQDVYVEVWCEKDALGGLLAEETEPYQVPLMVSRGFSSLTFLHAAAEAICEEGKPAWLYHVGDHDPSGILIPQKIEEEIRRYAPGCEIHFERLAVRPEQIDELGLPTRPTKSSDSRARGFAGESVDADAIPPQTLRAMVRGAIESHIDKTRLEQTKLVEALELESLRALRLPASSKDDAWACWERAGRADATAFWAAVLSLGGDHNTFGPAQWQRVAALARPATLNGEET